MPDKRQIIAMFDLFDVDTTVFTLIGYEMSAIEGGGTLLNLLSVWLVTRRSILTWPVGNIAVVLFAVLFYQIQLYADMIEQMYFFIAGFYGWWAWSGKSASNSGEIMHASKSIIAVCTAIIIAGTLGGGILLTRLDDLLPSLFGEPASYPYLDALTTLMSFVAMVLMAQRKIECWYLWIAVDVIGIGLYLQKDVVFLSMLYAVFLVLACRGLVTWTASAKEPLAVPAWA